jgi:hypothetical protein
MGATVFYGICIASGFSELDMSCSDFPQRLDGESNRCVLRSPPAAFHLCYTLPDSLFMASGFVGGRVMECSSLENL